MAHLVALPIMLRCGFQKVRSLHVKILVMSRMQVRISMPRSGSVGWILRRGFHQKLLHDNEMNIVDLSRPTEKSRDDSSLQESSKVNSLTSGIIYGFPWPRRVAIGSNSSPLCRYSIPNLGVSPSNLGFREVNTSARKPTWPFAGGCKFCGMPLIRLDQHKGFCLRSSFKAFSLPLSTDPSKISPYQPFTVSGYGMLLR